MIVYKKDIINELTEHGYTSYKILKENVLSQSSMQKLRDKELVGMRTLEKICDILKCQPGELLEWKE